MFSYHVESLLLRVCSEIDDIKIVAQGYTDDFTILVDVSCDLSLNRCKAKCFCAIER